MVICYCFLSMSTLSQRLKDVFHHNCNCVLITLPIWQDCFSVRYYCFWKKERPTQIAIHKIEWLVVASSASSASSSAGSWGTSTFARTYWRKCVA